MSGSLQPEDGKPSERNDMSPAEKIDILFAVVTSVIVLVTAYFVYKD
jgi:hypothetical protein